MPQQKNRARHSIVLAGIGPDSHSVGMKVLAEALRGKGYEVIDLGIQNSLEEVFEHLPSNVVMISSMDGQAYSTLQMELPEKPGQKAVVPYSKLRQRYSTEADKALWYIGGNLTMDSGTGAERRFEDLGFNRVHTKFTSVDVVLQELEADLQNKEPIATPQRRQGPTVLKNAVGTAHRLELRDFFRQRGEVLKHWPTLRDTRDAYNSAEFLLDQPSLADAQRLARSLGVPLVQPRIGVGDIDEMLRRFQAVTTPIQWADVVSYQVDSNTRADMLAEADAMYRDNPEALNGTPIMSWGAERARRVARQTPVPLQVRHSARNPGPLAEMAFAGGATAFEGGPICYNIPYYKDLTLAESLERWRYVDRLCGLYNERYGVVIDREYFGTLTATLIPPSLAIATGYIEASLAAVQGVKCVTIGYAEQGNREQDIAAIRTAQFFGDQLAQHYDGLQAHTVFCQYMAAFPSDPRASQQVIYESAKTAHMSGATRLLTKTIAEASNVPSLEDNLKGLRTVRRAFKDAPTNLTPQQEHRVQQEMAVIKAEVHAIVDAVLGIGRGDFSHGVAKAFRAGILDVPFAPSLYNQGLMTPVRDADGAVRVLNAGNTPYGDGDIGDFHRERISQRLHQEKLPWDEAWRLLAIDAVGMANLPSDVLDPWPLNTPERLGREQFALDVDPSRFGQHSGLYVPDFTIA